MSGKNFAIFWALIFSTFIFACRGSGDDICNEDYDEDCEEEELVVTDGDGDTDADSDTPPAPDCDVDCVVGETKCIGYLGPHDDGTNSNRNGIARTCVAGNRGCNYWQDVFCEEDGWCSEDGGVAHCVNCPPYGGGCRRENEGSGMCDSAATELFICRMDPALNGCWDWQFSRRCEPGYCNNRDARCER